MENLKFVSAELVDGETIVTFVDGNGKGYVMKVMIETKLPKGIKNSDVHDYLIEDFEDGVD